ncbi:hypothetical protein SK128_005350 [Halocaridina rubra]|uniref:Uncharacterized protein n=1 Tax=Halocaridina rubra TaxID=373956 RepID=A0AAN8XGA7_HALRR
MQSRNLRNLRKENPSGERRVIFPICRNPWSNQGTISPTPLKLKKLTRGSLALCRQSRSLGSSGSSGRDLRADIPGIVLTVALG